MFRSNKVTKYSEFMGDKGSEMALCVSIPISDCADSRVSRNSYNLGSVIDRLVDKVDCAPWATLSGASSACRAAYEKTPGGGAIHPALYTADERRRRDASPWTTVQGVLAPVQFGVFLVSLWLVISYLSTDQGLAAATISIVVKTVVLYAIMITGSIWEREVFGQYLFARPFFWEDVFSIGVLALHTSYLLALALGADVRLQMTIALLAYGSYVINATQFLLKLRAARLQQDDRQVGVTLAGGVE